MKYTNKLPSADHFYNLFSTTEWNEKYQLSSTELYTTLKKSWYTISVFNKDELIGFGRIISDGIAHALILDVIIHPNEQGKGIGKKVMEKLIAKCKKHKVRDIQLFSAKDKAGFYLKLGFKNRPVNAPGMEIEKYW